jgi:hypothetical protein
MVEDAGRSYVNYDPSELERLRAMSGEATDKEE